MIWPGSTVPGGALPTGVPRPGQRARSLPQWKKDLRQLSTVRNAVLAAVILSYVWRYHDLSPVLSPFRLAALSTAATWLFLLVAPRLGQLKQALRLPYIWMFVVWMIWIGFTTGYALAPERAWTVWLDDHFKTLTMFLFVVTCLTSFLAVRAVMALHVLGVAILMFFYTKGGYSLWNSPVPMYDVNDMALHLNMAIPMVIFFALSVRPPAARVALWGLAGTMAVCVLMTQSRGGLVTLALGLLFLAVKVKGVPWWMRLAPPAALVIGFSFLPQDAQDRLMTVFSPTEDYNYDADTGRMAIWERGLGYLEENRVTGVGVDNFLVAEATISPRARMGEFMRPQVPHNSFLQVATETGIPGFLLYVGMILTAAVRALRMRRALMKRRHDTLAAWHVQAFDLQLMSLAAFVVGGFFLSMGYQPMLFTIVAVIAGTEMSAARHLKDVAGHGVASSAARARTEVRRVPGSVPVEAVGSRR